jgi:hypothetical protein
VKIGLAVAVMAAISFPVDTHAQSEEQVLDASELWRLEVEAGCRAWGRRAYRGLIVAPGVWHEMPPRVELGLFVPLQLRLGDRGRVGVDVSVGVEPRLRFLIVERLHAELGFAIAAEDQERVHGIFSYTAGLNVNDIVSVRFTHERYRLDEGLPEDASANYVDLVFTGGAGKAVAHAQAAVLALLLVVTGGAK